jgi:hypothetical protein
MVVATGQISKIKLPEHDPDDFIGFEDKVYGELVCRQLEWALDFRKPGDDTVQRILRALLHNTLSITDRVRFAGETAFTALWKKLKAEAAIREAPKLDTYLTEFYSSIQLPGQSLLAYVKWCQELFSYASKDWPGSCIEE